MYTAGANALQEFLGQKTVTCHMTGKMNGDREIGTCEVDGVDLGDFIVGKGWGRDLPKFSQCAYADKKRLPGKPWRASGALIVQLIFGALATMTG